MRVLVIEDEKKTGAFVRKGLSEQGMTVDVAEDGQSGLWLAQTGQYDMAIVDVMLRPQLHQAVVTQLISDTVITKSCHADRRFAEVV